MKSYLPKKMSKQKGFTLIELLVVIGILAVLLAITLIAINPARQFAQANNTQRSSDVNTILNAVNQYMADNKGVLPTALLATCILGASCTLSEDNDPLTTTDVNLCSEVVSDYLAALPGDPQTATANIPVTEAVCATVGLVYDTGYEIYIGGNNRITVSAPDAETIGTVTPIIAVTR